MVTININPKVDFVFRKLFGSEENKDLLLSLVNSVVEPEIHLTDLVIKNPFNLAAYKEAKESILDIKAVDQDGAWYDIEMQLQPHTLYGRRAIYYLAKTYTSQLSAGEDYSQLNTTIGIHFMDFKYFDDDRMLRQFTFKDVETHEAPSELDCVRLYFIEMPKFNKDWTDVRTTLDRWVAFLNRAQQLSERVLPKELTNEPAVTKAVRELERIGLNPDDRVIYEGEVKKLMVDAIQLKTAEDRGMQKGMQVLVMQQMTRRIGDIPATISAKLQRLNTKALEELGQDLLDFTSYADVERWFTQH